jgi:hypothetical protein
MATMVLDSNCTGPHARISEQKAAACHLQCLLFCCCSIRLASHETRHAWDSVVTVPYCFLVTGAGLYNIQLF